MGWNLRGILQIQLLVSVFVGIIVGDQVMLENDNKENGAGNQIQSTAAYLSTLPYPVGHFSGHLQHWSLLQSFSQATPFPFLEDTNGIEPRPRKAMADLAQLYTHLWNRQKARARNLYDQRSANGLHHHFPPTTSGEYFISEFRRLFSTNPAPQRPYSMRLRWG